MTIPKKFNGFTDQKMVIKIAFGVLFGVILGAILQVYQIESFIIFAELLGKLFVGTLKAIAPLIVFVLICESIATNEFSENCIKALKKIILLYIIGTMAASICAVAANYIYPVTLVLQSTPNITVETSNLQQLLVNIVLKMVDNRSKKSIQIYSLKDLISYFIVISILMAYIKMSYNNSIGGHGRTIRQKDYKVTLYYLDSLVFAFCLLFIVSNYTQK